MREVAAHTAALSQRLDRAAGRSGVLVAELDSIVDEVADRLNARPARRRLAEQIPRGLHQPVGLAVAAAQQEHQRVVRQVGDRMFFRAGVDGIGLA